MLTENPVSDNPLLQPSPLPFHAPPFDAITDGDFRPAFDEGIRQHLAEIAAIADNPAPPTFDNTLVALERSGQALKRVALVFNLLADANTNDALQQLQQDMAPRLAAHNDAVYLNAKLFARIETLYSNRGQQALDPDSLRLLEHQHQQFVLAGARLSESDQARLKILNEEDAALCALFLAKLLAATREGAVVVRDPSELEGLSQADVDAASAAAASRGLDGQWVLSLHNTTQQPLLRSLRHRSVRERLFTASLTRASRGDANDTCATIVRLSEIRAARAALLGQPSHAAWRLQDQMAKSSAQVERFLAQVVSAALAKAKAEASEIQALMDAEGGGASLEPWDWNFYADRVRQAAYDLAEAEIAPYFELERVLRDGVFNAAGQLYGVAVVERHDLPVYHPEVRVFDVLDATGSPLGLFYADFFRRDNKKGGAWMDNLLLQSTLLGTRPIIYNIFNYTKPAAGQPTLLSLDDVRTLFHEFGHALHGLFASQRYPSLSGTAVARDFVELPSQFNEHWAYEPQVLAKYARHHLTGEPMPPALAAKIVRAATFNQGYALTEVLAAAKVDIHWHSVPEGSETTGDVDRIERDALRHAHLDVAAVPPRYHSSYFLHIWANGYDAGYYAYLWAEMLAHDAFAWFSEHGGLTRENGQRFRDLVLSRGNTKDYAEMFREFRGRDPVIDPMLAFRGLSAERRPGN